MTATAQEYWWVKGVFGDTTPRPEGFRQTAADEFDVIVVGSGMSGFATAILAHDAGKSVLMLEASNEVGGTTYKSGAGMWIPNNAIMRSLGIFDDRDECLDYIARVAHPSVYDPAAERYGLGEWEWEKITTFYDNAADAIDALVAAGALSITLFPSFTGRYPAMISYHCELDMSIRGFYRHIMPLKPSGIQGIGPELVRQLSEAAKARGIELRTGQRVSGVVQNAAGEVAGVTVDTPTGTARLFARQGVVFGTGGFPHNLELLDRYWRGPLYSSCAVPSAQGDFVTIGVELGAELSNMRDGWLYEDILEKAAPDRVSLEGGINVPPGDSMIFVNWAGKRVVNEKIVYQERAQTYWERDDEGGYPNRVLFMVYDETVATDDRPWLHLGAFRKPKPWVIEGATVAELAANIQDRLASYEQMIGPLQLAPDFAAQLGQSIERFNGYARAGKDEEFQRGETLKEFDWHGPARDGNTANPTMSPFQEGGRYYCVLLCGMVLDTNGGPKTNGQSQVLRDDGSVIPGLYGVGNCVAPVAGEGYISGGSTLGPAATFAYLAAKSVVQEPARELVSARAQVPA